MPGRSGTGPEHYRYGFNGKESDNEVKGTGNSIDYGFRTYDPRIGRFLSVDPLTSKYPELTPYQFASNTPIAAIDIDGLEGGGAYEIPQEKFGYVNPMKVTQSEQMAGITLKAKNSAMSIPPPAPEAPREATIGASEDPDAAAKINIINGVKLAPGGELGLKLIAGEKITKSDVIWGAIGFIPIGKIAGPLVKGSIRLFKGGIEVAEEAYLIGKWGHVGTAPYNTIKNAIAKGGNFVAKTEEEAMTFLNDAFKDIPNETGKAESRFGYRIDKEVAKDATEGGVRNGHTGTHINYYDKKNNISGTIQIEGEIK
jgi:RHS repeat-associated protein